MMLPKHTQFFLFKRCIEQNRKTTDKQLGACFIDSQKTNAAGALKTL